MSDAVASTRNVAALQRARKFSRGQSKQRAAGGSSFVNEILATELTPSRSGGGSALSRMAEPLMDAQQMQSSL